MGAQQSHLLYQVPSPPGYDKSLSGLLWIEENGMKIPAIYREYKDKETETKSPITLIYCGSHYNDLGACSQWLSALHYTLRINVIAFDYPGYGLHTGEPSENDLYASASAVFFYVKNTLKVPTKNIVLLGKSLGTAVAVNLAYEIECGSKKGDNEKFGGIVLVSPFSSLSAIVGSRLKFTKSDLYDNVKKFEKIQSLTLVAHGENDEIIDIKIARKTASKISNLWKLLELDCGHLDIDDHNDFMDILIEFIDHIGESIGNFTPHAVKPVVIPSQYQKEQTVDNWLEAINLSKYAQQFLINGYYNMDVVKTIEQIDLQAMDISSEEDQQIILNSINDLLCGGSGVPKPEEPKKETSENAKTVKRVSYGPMDVNPESFNQVLVHYNCSPAQDSGIPSSWDEFMAFASSVNIPYWEDEKDVLLAKGFFGEVIKSTWKDKPVIKRKLQYKRNQFRKFCQEAVLLCQLKHPNLVEVVGACMEKNVCPCLITEYITGGNLTNFVLSKKKLNDKELFKIANGITRGLQFLHSCIPPIVHRDLTPNNIFVTEDLEVKLTDFGMGRPPSFLYMAPELFSKQPANIKGDIYSLGLIFYFLVTGTLPFEGLTAAEAAAKATKLSVRPAIPQTVPAGWKSLITSCWHKNPLSRPTTEQILQTLRKLDTEDESPAETPELIPISLIESPDGVQGTSEFIPEKVEPKNINSGGGLLAFQLKSLVNDPKYSDFTVRVGNEKFAAHRAILAARSDLFAAQIEESENGELIILEDVASPSSVLCLLQFLYSGFLDLSSENLLDVMNAANNLNITQAVDICREFLSANGVPIKVSESSNENTERIQDVQESLMAAEHNIQNIETLLNSLNEKLETVTSRMNSLPTL